MSKHTYNDDAYNSPFASRLRDLLDRKGVKQEELGNAIGKKRQTVNTYTLGQSFPSFPALCSIADFFNVSTDYLLGRTDVETTDIDIQTITQKTGISESNVHQLFSDQQSPINYLISPLINDLISFVSHSNVLTSYILMMDTLNVPNHQFEPRLDAPEYYYHADQIRKLGYVVLSAEESFSFFCSQISDNLKRYFEDKYIDHATWSDKHGND